jgi:hypothetical protein
MGRCADMIKKRIIWFLISMIIISGCVKEEFQITPTGKVISPSSKSVSTEVGTGWSSNENPAQAVKEASDIVAGRS